jgi:hypothetical protein
MIGIMSPAVCLHHAWFRTWFLLYRLHLVTLAHASIVGLRLQLYEGNLRAM